MRVLISSLNYYPEPTGIGKYSGEMAAWLAQRGHEVDVIAAPPYYPQWVVHAEYKRKRYLEERLDGVRVFRAPLYVPTRRVSTVGRLILESSFTVSSSVPWLRLLTTRRRHDVVIAVVPPLQTSVWPILYSMVRRVPLLLHVQDLQVDAAVQLGFFHRVPWVSRAMFALEAGFLRRATKVTTVTDAMRRRIVRKGLDDDRVEVFPNWADVDVIRPLPHHNALRRALGLSEGDIFVQYSGNMGQKQGLEVLLAAARRLSGEPSVVFGLFGEGASRATLEARSRAEGLRNVRFHDLVPWSDVPELLAAGDIHVVPQKREAADLLMPSKVANIMAAGRPVVATCDSGTALCAVLEASGGGKTVTPGDADELAGAIKLLAGDERMRLEMGARNRRYAEEHLAKEAVLGDFEQQLRCMVGSELTIP